MRGIDISNLQGPPSAYRFNSWYRDAEFVIVQAIAPPRPYPGWDCGGYTADQLRTAKADGKKIGVYVWLWNSFSSSPATKADIAARLACIPDDVQLDMRVWLDMEDTTQDHGPARQQDVLDALEVLDAWSTERGLPPAGVYSGDWYVRGYMDAWFPPERMYWMADYSIAPQLFPSRPLHQFTSSPIDTDEMLDSEIVSSQLVAAVPAAEDNMPVPQDYLDKFGPAATWPDVAANLEGIISMLTSELSTDEPKLAAVRTEVAKRWPKISLIRKAVA